MLFCQRIKSEILFAASASVDPLTLCQAFASASRFSRASLVYWEWRTAELQMCGKLITASSCRMTCCDFLGIARLTTPVPLRLLQKETDRRFILRQECRNPLAREEKAGCKCG